MIIQQAALAQGLLGKEKTAQMREGEMFPAKVVKVLPNGMAELSTGTTTMITKLEVPLQSGERYWFRVTSNENGIELKVITPPLAAQENIPKLAKDLLIQLSLPLTKENKAFVEMMMKEQQPLTKELIAKAGEWLQKGPLSEGLQVIKAMAGRSLPMIKDVFEPLLASYSRIPVSQMTEELAARLQQLNPPSASAEALMKLLKEWQLPLEKHMSQKIVSAVIDQLFMPEKAPVQAAALDLVKSWGMVPSVAGTADEALVQIMNQWKKEASQRHPDAQATPLKEAITRFIEEPANKEKLQRLEQALTAQAARADKRAAEPLITEIKLLISSLKSKDIGAAQLAVILKAAAKVSIQQAQPHEALHQLASLFNKEAEEIIRAVKNEAVKIQSLSLASLSKKEILFQQLALSAENDMRLHLSAKEAHTLIKDSFQLLGTDLEGLLGNGRRAGEELEKTLKPQLLRLLNEGVPAPVKDAAEQLLGRMNAQSLLSADNGPLQQLVMQVPVNLFGFHTDLTLQWSGRKTEKGKLDSDYCRILFYLTLENIKETIIDMQVQNRIVQLQIFNETQGLKRLADSLIPALKEGIEEKGYQLSNVQFKQPEKKEIIPIVEAMERERYEGVDIRI